MFMTICSILVAEAFLGSTISLIEDEGVIDNQDNVQRKMTINAETWEPLEKLHKGEGWPRSDLYVKKKYEELKESYQDWPDRYLLLTLTILLSLLIFMEYNLGWQQWRKDTAKKLKILTKNRQLLSPQPREFLKICRVYL